MRPVITTALVWALCASYASAARDLVIVEKPQSAQQVQGVVLDRSGEPIFEMTVTDRTDDGVAILRTTVTDAKGRFHFSTQRGKEVYCLRFDHPLWNPLQVRLKLDKHAPRRGITARPVIGG